MKSLVVLALLTAFMTSACTTLANRRDLHRPGKSKASWEPYGEWEKKERNL